MSGATPWDLPLAGMDYQNSKKRGKRQHLRQRELMFLSKELERNQMHWYKNDYLGGKLTPWELAGSGGAPSGGGGAPTAPMEQDSNIGSKLGERLMGYADQRNQEAMNEATLDNQREVVNMQERSRFVQALIGEGVTSREEVRDLTNLYEGFVADSDQAVLYGTDVMSPKREANRIKAAAQQLDEEMFAWEQGRALPNFVTSIGEAA